MCGSCGEGCWLSNGPIGDDRSPIVVHFLDELVAYHGAHQIAPIGRYRVTLAPLHPPTSIRAFPERGEFAECNDCALVEAAALGLAPTPISALLDQLRQPLFTHAHD